MATDTDLAERTSGRDWRSAVLEGPASVIAVVATAAIFVNYVGAHLSFFGAVAVISTEQVRMYWALVAVLAVGLVGSLAGACWRRAGWAWCWHLVVVLVGVVTAVQFSLTTAGPVPEEAPPSPPSHHTGPVCHSGGDSRGCPGG